MTTTYKDIPGWPGYRAGDDGSIWSCRNPNGTGLSSVWRQLKPTLILSSRWSYRKGERFARKDGPAYHKVKLRQDGEPKTRLVHSLVLMAFVGPCPPGYQACHWDGDPQNNRLDNLRWDTPKNNIADQVRHGTRKNGESNHAAKLTSEQALEIRRRVDAGESQRILGREFGVARSLIGRIAQGKIWTHLWPRNNVADQRPPGTRPRGELHRGSKLTDQNVLEIRRRVAAGESQRRLGVEFAVAQTLISRIGRRNAWKHLGETP